jgi:hypothetical protein
MLLLRYFPVAFDVAFGTHDRSVAARQPGAGRGYVGAMPWRTPIERNGLSRGGIRTCCLESG